MMRRAVRLAACLLLAAGCAHHQITVSPPVPRAAAPGVSPHPLPAPLVVARVDVISEGKPGSGSDAFVNRVMMELRGTRAFPDVLPPEVSEDAPIDSVQVLVALVQHVDEHLGSNVAKALAIGFSMLLLMPFVQIDLGYHAELHALAVTCDDWRREYASAADGELSYGFGSNEILVRRELIERVVEQALADLAGEIASDAALRERVESLVREGDCQQRVLPE